jgi:hypothetical protein
VECWDEEALPAAEAVIRIFYIRSSAVCGGLDPGILHVLEAAFLHRAKSIDQKQEVCQQ